MSPAWEAFCAAALKVTVSFCEDAEDIVEYGEGCVGAGVAA